MSLITEIYKPASLVGQVYALPYGASGPLSPIGNVLDLQITHDETVSRQADFTRLGGGTHAQFRRVNSASIAFTMADINMVNFTRAVLATAAESAAGSVTAEAHKAYRGGLIRLAHLQPSAVVVKKASTPVAAAGNYEVRPEGLYILPDATGLADADDVTVDYTHVATATLEALTQKAPELQICFAGLNEADSGKPVVVDLWRVGQGVARQLALLNGNFMGLPVEGELQIDPTKTGAGISRYYRVQHT
jgi:hypothetical protein